MAAEAQTLHPHGEVQIASIATARSSGEFIQLPDGRAAFCGGLNARAVGDAATFITNGVVTALKSTSVILLPGQEGWWDPTNNKITYRIAAEANGGFYAGLICEPDTVAAATTTVQIDVNARRPYNMVDFSTGFDLETTLTAGVPLSRWEGGELRLSIDATNEAQRADALSYESIATTGDGIAEFEVNVVAAAGSATDISLGLANATSSTDADAIAESIFIHLDGGSQNIYAESDDGTTEVSATDTTIDWTAGTKFFVQMDMRTQTDVQIYVNGALMLTATVFAVGAATGPWKMLFHMEKTASTNTAEVRVRNPKFYRCLTP